MRNAVIALSVFERRQTHAVSGAPSQGSLCGGCLRSICGLIHDALLMLRRNEENRIRVCYPGKRQIPNASGAAGTSLKSPNALAEAFSCSEILTTQTRFVSRYRFHST